MPSDQRATEKKNQPGIFISYRRTDNPDAVGRLYDRLASEFGKARVFKDVDSIPLGQDFRGHLNEVVGGCAAVLAVIGPRWTDARNSAGQRRLEDADDFVRIELEAALARNIPVVPVLVGHASMPGTPDLPSSLASMVYRQSIEVRPDPDFHHDSTRLVSALRQILDPNTPKEVEPITHAGNVPPVSPKADTRSGRALAWSIAAAAGLVTAALAFPAWKHLRETPPPETRVDIITPATDQPADFALSPDGRQIVFVGRGDGAPRLWLRSLSAATAQSLPGTEGASSPFWSPDGRSVGFFAAGSLKRLDLGGGQPQVLAAVQNRPDGGTWNADGVILFQQGRGGSIERIAASGGTATEVIKSNAQYTAPAFPRFLPDGRQFLFAVIGGTAPGIYLGALDGRTPKRLTADVQAPQYLPSGWMLWSRGGTIVAQKLDLSKATLIGEPVTLGDSIPGAYSVSATGVVAYRMGTFRGYQLTWFDRSGTARGTIGDSIDNPHASPRIAPDGRRVAVTRWKDNADIWLLEAERSARFTFYPDYDGLPVWSPDGARIVFSRRSPKGLTLDLYQKLSSGAGVEELLLASDQSKVATSWSADGRFLLYFSVDPKTGLDLWVLPMTGDRKPFPLLKTPFAEEFGQFSPDGKWVAYESSESGLNEIYVRPFVLPGAAGADAAVAGSKWQVSTKGGSFAAWRPDGKEIYFISPVGEMMAAPITTNGSMAQPGSPMRLFQARTSDGSNREGKPYDVAQDGRFLINKLDADVAPQITLLQNWNPDAAK